MTATETHKLQFETPGRNMGQIVTYSFARTPTGAEIGERHDASDGSLSYYWVKTKRDLTDAEKARYGLVSRG